MFTLIGAKTGKPDEHFLTVAVEKSLSYQRVIT